LVKEQEAEEEAVLAVLHLSLIARGTKLCDFREVTVLLWGSVSSSVK
jgi:hypothetical protein